MESTKRSIVWLTPTIERAPRSKRQKVDNKKVDGDIKELLKMLCNNKTPKEETRDLKREIEVLGPFKNWDVSLPKANFGKTFSLLPIEMIDKILEFLELRELLPMRKVNIRWRDLVDANVGRRGVCWNELGGRCFLEKNPKIQLRYVLNTFPNNFPFTKAGLEYIQKVLPLDHLGWFIMGSAPNQNALPKLPHTQWAGEQAKNLATYLFENGKHAATFCLPLALNRQAALELASKIWPEAFSTWLNTGENRQRVIAGVEQFFRYASLNEEVWPAWKQFTQPAAPSEPPGTP